ncbi:hypothetical protein [Goodfellowiella coeruleoviolacea]|uniref:PRC-barrel domain containing protein n=1 Tax=Goodfellowiella coeruleoviolacea TaxID=334858 RepID=A0AAE3GFU3_9PSEU|nr:hypothetical protein [Goodfellowiella coeruleoviolacea]MCP2165373.1 hypothetical protein [Goodfellowiella coeruleoviolacea]
MRASEVLDRPVVDPEGRRVGRIVEVRATPEQSPGTQVIMVVDGFVIARGHLRLLDYQRYHEHGPALLRWLVKRLHRWSRFAPHDTLTLPDGPGPARLGVAWTELPYLLDVAWPD